MDVKIYPSTLSGALKIEPLKSVALRAIIASAFADTDTEILIKGETEDIFSTVKCLNKMGVGVLNYNGKISITPLDFTKEIVCEESFDVGDSTATFRFLSPIISVLCGGGTFTGSARLPKKQTEAFLSSLKGVGFTSNSLPLKLNGKLKGGNLTAQANIGTQAISGILLALPLLKDKTTLTVLGEIPSNYLVDLTVQVMRDFGIDVSRNGNVFTVPSNQKYISPKVYEPEGDYGLSAYYLCAGKIGNGVSITGLSKNSFQPEKNVLELIEKCLNQDNINLNGANDLVYPLTVLACYKKGETVISGVARKTDKNVEKFNSFISQLNKMGATVTSTENGAIIKGNGKLKGGVFVDSFADAKTAMALAIASTGADEPTYLLSAEFATKSYPAFFNDFLKLGGKCQVI